MPKKMPKESQAALTDTAYKTGLLSTSRLHDLFINLGVLNLADYKNAGRNLAINNSYAESPLGILLLLPLKKLLLHGVCR